MILSFALAEPADYRRTRTVTLGAKERIDKVCRCDIIITRFFSIYIILLYTTLYSILYTLDSFNSTSNLHYLIFMNFPTHVLLYLYLEPEGVIPLFIFSLSFKSVGSIAFIHVHLLVTIAQSRAGMSRLEYCRSD